MVSQWDPTFSTCLFSATKGHQTVPSSANQRLMSVWTDKQNTCDHHHNLNRCWCGNFHRQKYLCWESSWVGSRCVVQCPKDAKTSQTKYRSSCVQKLGVQSFQTFIIRTIGQKTRNIFLNWNGTKQVLSSYAPDVTGAKTNKSVEHPTKMNDFDILQFSLILFCCCAVCRLILSDEQNFRVFLLTMLLLCKSAVAILLLEILKWYTLKQPEGAFSREWSEQSDKTPSVQWSNILRRELNTFCHSLFSGWVTWHWWS